MAKFKMIALEEDGENAVNRFLDEYADELIRGLKLGGGVTISCRRFAVVTRPRPLRYVTVFECEHSCWTTRLEFEKYPSLTAPGCTWSLLRDSEFPSATVCSNGKYLLGPDDDPEDEIFKMPLEYYFGKDNLADFLIKRAAGMDVEIDPAYDPEKYPRPDKSQSPSD